MQSTIHTNHPQPTQWSKDKGMFICIEETQYSPERRTSKLKLDFADHSLTQEAGR